MEAVAIPRDRVDLTLRAMADLAREGSRHPAILAHVRDGARRLSSFGLTPSPLDTFRAVYGALAGSWTYAEDPYGEDHVEPPARLLDALAGDCDDGATLTAALARAAGLRTAFVVFYGQNGSAEHVAAAVQDEGGEWVLADLTYNLPLGSDPAHEGRRDVFPLDAAAEGKGLGFLSALVGAVGSVAGGIFGGGAAKDAANAQKQAAWLQGYAATRVAKLNAASAKETAEAQERIVTTQAAAQRETDAARIAQGREAFGRSMRYLEGVTPAVLVFLLVRLLAPILDGAGAASSSPRRRPARTKARKAAA